MITEKDLQEAIAECQGQRNPNANTCIKLAAFYTIKRELFGDPEPRQAYSYAPAPESADDTYVMIDSDSEFAHLVDGRKQKDVWPVIDELMDTIKMLHPRLYNAVLSKF